MPPKLMVLNGTHAEAAIHAVATSAGVDIVFYAGPYGDEEALEAELVRAGMTRRVQGIWSADGNHWAEANRAAARLGLPNARDITAPPLALLEGQGLPLLAPQVLAENEHPTLTRYPVWVRPCPLPGYGVSAVVDAPEDLDLGTRLAYRKTPRAIFQPAVAGATCSVFGFKLGRSFVPVELLGLTMEAKGFRLPLGYTYPVDLSSAAYADALALAHAAARALPDCTALLEIELVIDDAHQQISDVRLHHAWPEPLPTLFQEGMGIDVAAQWLRTLCGEAPRVSARKNLGVAVAWFNCRSGVVQGTTGLEKKDVLPGLAALALRAEKGDIVRHCVDLESRDRHGYALCIGNTATTARERLRAVHEAIKIETSPYLD